MHHQLQSAARPSTFDPDRAAVTDSDWLTTNQVGRLLQISPSSLEKARSVGSGPFSKLPYHKIGRSVRYHRRDVLAFLQDRKIAGSSLVQKETGR
ncbi:helix-turn-helix domain-containing protein [Roseibium sp. TrichSKD4]|uniref:helix-turn-helix domain-containing protein n=1 Tax=Roseibium sp. TrichSKD4 TaxID=744980 RepID=UPI0009FDA691